MSLYPSATSLRATHRLPVLLRASHPEASVAVTVFVTALALSAGRGTAGSLGVGAAVLAGQLSVGWCNDAVDARRDTAVGRRDKPVAAGALARRVVWGAAAAALALCVPLSLLGGVTAATVHLAGVLAGGWAYNLLLKGTVFSPLPYALGFASLPAFVTLGLPSQPWPAWWATMGSAVLGVGAHLVNVLPDIEDDLATGVRGLPQRLGPTACRWLAPAVMLTALGVLTAGPPGTAGAAGWAVAAVAGCAAVAATAVRHGDRRWPFRAAIAVAGLAVVQLLLRGADIA
ncbi:UbiA family prenyltransferase [Streptomyces pristinaespiralis]|uniref:UbiA family prenyltransferase n=1 Tax=Streptomyces pristinaespiralis TaxID=38300 RepID=UPI0023AF1CBD|nr:UbiA family prenyltransferase [Streptomyces pristinaespiralis]